MAKQKRSESKSRRSSSAAARVEAVAKKDEASWLSPAAIRETVESVIIAFVLAFLFRTFEAEAFVIPTGSMAPTLMGKNKDLECPMCNYRYQVSASDRHNSDIASKVYHGTCPMCRFTADLAPGNPEHQSYPTYDGDRILVAKFPYEFADPKPWDVVVFKYPGDATMNYIKRLVGLPGETIRIHRGDLWIHEPDDPEDHFEIARKPPEKLLAMLQPVYDNDYAPTITGRLGWPARWTRKEGPGENPWTNEDLSSFEIDGSAKGEAWIVYQHRVPTPEQWQTLESSGKKRADKSLQNDVKPQLITDFTAYNTSDNDQTGNVPPTLIQRGYGQHWVGDLAVQFELVSKSAGGKVIADLVKAGRHFQCHFDLASGNAELTIGGDEPEAKGYRRTAATAVRGPGRHAIIFANVDDELSLWVDGRAVAFKDPSRPAAPPPRDGRTESRFGQHPNGYESALLDGHVPTREDLLSPVGIAAAEGASVKVQHIKVLRDVYYIAVFNEGRKEEFRPTDFTSGPDLYDPRKDDPRNWTYLSSSATWENIFSDANMKKCTIKLDPPNPADPAKDQFFVLGDNSAQSADGREWAGQYWVERELLIGKALFIYWPHGWGIPYYYSGNKWHYYSPFGFNPVPYFGRMHLVR